MIRSFKVGKLYKTYACQFFYVGLEDINSLKNKHYMPEGETFLLVDKPSETTFIILYKDGVYAIPCLYSNYNEFRKYFEDVS